MKSPTMHCERCDGTGKAPLTPKLMEVWEAWGTHRYRSSADIRAALREKGKLRTHNREADETIVHKRMKTMTRMGVIRRVKEVTPKANGRDVRLHKAWVFERV